MNARVADEDEMDIFAFQERLTEKMNLLKVDEGFASRYVNDGFSGGEKKRKRNPPDGSARTDPRGSRRD